MKTIEVDDELYQYIASQTLHIGEDASSILRRLLMSNSQPVMDKVEDFKKNESSNLLPLEILITSDDFLAEKKLVSRFLQILSTLYTCNKSLFSVAATSLQGRKRRYIAKDEETLSRSGNNTKPQQIPNTPYMVITNSNTDRKLYIIESLMANMNMPEELINLVKIQFTHKK